MSDEQQKERMSTMSMKVVACAVAVSMVLSGGGAPAQVFAQANSESVSHVATLTAPVSKIVNLSDASIPETIQIGSVVVRLDGVQLLSNISQSASGFELTRKDGATLRLESVQYGDATALKIGNATYVVPSDVVLDLEKINPLGNEALLSFLGRSLADYDLESLSFSLPFVEGFEGNAVLFPANRIWQCGLIADFVDGRSVVVARDLLEKFLHAKSKIEMLDANAQAILNACMIVGKNPVQGDVSAWSDYYLAQTVLQAISDALTARKRTDDILMRLSVQLSDHLLFSFMGIDWMKMQKSQRYVRQLAQGSSGAKSVRDLTPFEKPVDKGRLGVADPENWELVAVEALGDGDMEFFTGYESESECPRGFASIAQGRTVSMPASGGSATTPKAIMGAHKMVHPAIRVEVEREGKTFEEWISIIEMRIGYILGQNKDARIVLPTSIAGHLEGDSDKSIQEWLASAFPEQVKSGQITTVMQRGQIVFDNKSGSVLRYTNGHVAICAENHLWAFLAALADKTVMMNILENTDAIGIFGNGDNVLNYPRAKMVDMILNARGTGEKLATVAVGTPSKVDTKGGIFVKCTYRHKVTSEEKSQNELREISDFATKQGSRYSGITIDPTSSEYAAMEAKKQFVDDIMGNKAVAFNLAFYAVDLKIFIARMLGLSEDDNDLLAKLNAIDQSVWARTISKFCDDVLISHKVSKSVPDELGIENPKGYATEQAVQDFIVNALKLMGSDVHMKGLLAKREDTFLPYKGTFMEFLDRAGNVIARDAETKVDGAIFDVCTKSAMLGEVDSALKKMGLQLVFLDAEGKTIPHVDKNKQVNEKAEQFFNTYFKTGKSFADVRAKVYQDQVTIIVEAFDIFAQYDRYVGVNEELNKHGLQMVVGGGGRVTKILPVDSLLTIKQACANERARKQAAQVQEDAQDVSDQALFDAVASHVDQETFKNFSWFLGTLKKDEKIYEDNTLVDARQFLAALVKSENWAEITNRFYKFNEPGTAGVRGERKIGTVGINEKIVALFVEAHARYIISSYAELGGKQMGRELAVLLGYDSRFGSLEYDAAGNPVGPGFYMKLAASIYAAHGIKVYMFDREVPTPEVSFALSELLGIKPWSALIGTASHNKPLDNGIKPYDYYGGQVVNQRIQAIVKNIESFKDDVQVGDYDTLKNKRKIVQLTTADGDRIDAAYLRKVSQAFINVTKKKKFMKSKIDMSLKVAFTSVNGTAHRLVPKLWDRLGLAKNVNYFMEPDQTKPDGNFTTVPVPNPETKAALTRVVALGEKVDADIVVGTDPDADRIGVGVKMSDAELAAFDGNAAQVSSGYYLLTGNQQLVVLTDYVLSQLKEKYGKLPDNSVIAKTLVSTDLVTVLAAAYGVMVVEPHVGFKYIGEKIHYYAKKAYQDARKDAALCDEFKRLFGKDLTDPKQVQYRKLTREQRVFILARKSLTYLIGGEESYGSLMGDWVKDKDAVIISGLFAEVAGYYKKQGKTITERLNEIYTQYGYWREETIAIEFKGQQGMKDMAAVMTDLRTKGLQEIGGKRVIASIDFQNYTAIGADGALLYDAAKPADLKNYTGYFTVNGVKVPGFWTADAYILDQVRASALLPKADVMMFVLEDGSKVIARPSGTEPKLKYYVLAKGSTADELRGMAQDRKNVDAFFNQLKTEIMARGDAVKKALSVREQSNGTVSVSERGIVQAA